MDITPQFFLSVVQIIWIDLLLSGDNAVVIALACRSLPPRQRRAGIVMGAGVALGLRIAFAIVIAELLDLPYLRVIGAVLLLWIAVKLIIGEDEHEKEVPAARSLWRAVWTIAIADAVMSLDNVVAITAAARGNAVLFIFGLLFSLPLIVFGASVVMALLSRFPILIWAGGGLLGWVAGEMLASDPVILDQFGEGQMHDIALPVAAGATILVLAVGLLLRRRAEMNRASHPRESAG